MNEKEIKAVVAATVSELLDKREEESACNLGLDRDKHEEEHRFIKSLMGVSDKLSNIGWGFFGSAVKTLGMGIVGFICLCAIAWARVELKKLLNQ